MNEFYRHPINTAITAKDVYLNLSNGKMKLWYRSGDVINHLTSRHKRRFGRFSWSWLSRISQSLREIPISFWNKSKLSTTVPYRQICITLTTFKQSKIWTISWRNRRLLLDRTQPWTTRQRKNQCKYWIVTVWGYAKIFLTRNNKDRRRTNLGIFLRSLALLLSSLLVNQISRSFSTPSKNWTPSALMLSSTAAISGCQNSTDGFGSLNWSSRGGLPFINIRR